MNILRTAFIFGVAFALGATVIPLRFAAAQDSGNVRVQLPSPLIQKFDSRGSLSLDSKIAFYSGWANGLFATTKDPGTLALGRCLEKLSFQQIVTIVDKWHAEHREKYQNPIGAEITEAITAAGTPCAGIKVEPETKNVSCATDTQGRVNCHLVGR